MKQSTLDTSYFRMLHCAHGLYYRDCTVIGVIAPDNAILKPEGNFGQDNCSSLSEANRCFQLIATNDPDLPTLHDDFQTAIKNATLLQTSLPGDIPGFVSTFGDGENTSPCFYFRMPIFDIKVNHIPFFIQLLLQLRYRNPLACQFASDPPISCICLWY